MLSCCSRCGLWHCRGSGSSGLWPGSCRFRLSHGLWLCSECFWRFLGHCWMCRGPWWRWKRLSTGWWFRSTGHRTESWRRLSTDQRVRSTGRLTESWRRLSMGRRFRITGCTGLSTWHIDNWLVRRWLTRFLIEWPLDCCRYAWWCLGLFANLWNEKGVYHYIRHSVCYNNVVKKLKISEILSKS